MRDESILSSIIAHERLLMVVVRVRLSKVLASICMRWCALVSAGRKGRPLVDGPLLELFFFRADLIDCLVGRITFRLGLKRLLLGSRDIVLYS